MNKLHQDGVLLDNDGWPGSANSNTSSFEEVRTRVAAHGHVPMGNTKENTGYYYFLYRDAKRLVELLDEANKKIAFLSGPKASKNDFVLNIGFALDGEKIARAVQAFNQEMAS